jgi:hypothetical protein|tara:strand:+ start:141 stop:860 length:720 start_codon:yes stop_codon:yes gene_type:complete
MSYFKTKKGSVEEAISGVSKHITDSTYQDKFKKELDKAGKGIASMSDQEKKAFFNKIDKSHKAKNEDVKEDLSLAPKGKGKEAAKKLYAKEGGVKAWLMDMEDEAAGMKMKDFLDKYAKDPSWNYKELKRIWFRANGYADEYKGVKEGDPTADKMNKRQRTHVGEEQEIKGKDLPDSSNSLLETVTSVWNMAAEEQEKREKEATYFKADKKEDKDKKKAMTGSKATKVDTEPEVDFDSK